MSQTHPHAIKILYVDDEPEMLQIFKDSMKSSPYEILTALNGKEAFELIELHFDRLAIVLADYTMPVMNGFELRKAMMKDHKNIPFIMISANVSKEDAAKSIDLKISAYVEKPFDPDLVMNLIQKEAKERINALNDDAEMLSGFVVEAENLIDEMEGLILILETDPHNAEAINKIFACAHTIKGTSGFFKPDHVHRFTHKYEDYLSVFKKTPSLLSQNEISVLLRGLDTIKILVSNLKNRVHGAQNIDELCSIFTKTASDAPTSTPTPTPAPTISPAATPQAPVKQASEKGSEELRVSVSLLDQFMERSGELTVLRNMINKVIKVVGNSYPSDQNITALEELLNEMHKVNNFMQGQVIDLRKVPLKQVFKPLQRTLRDLNTNLKKNIQLEIRGEDLRVDHTIAETLNKCLIHMLRNSADHGIENSETRLKAGKPKDGKIILTATESNEFVIVRLSDDGKGIDADKIKEKSIEKGLLTPASASQMSKSELQMMIFEPGFSTAEKITDVSGRGVGTDMVKKTIESIQGRIELESEVGKGAEFILHLPIPKSVLIISSLLIKSGGHTFALPQDEIMRVNLMDRDFIRNHVKTIGNKSFYQSEEEFLPIVSLDEVMDLPDLKTPNQTLITITSKSHRYCLKVDEVLESEDIVVKKMGSWFQSMNIYSGATFLGDGKIGMILDTEGLMNQLLEENQFDSAMTQSKLIEKEESASPESAPPQESVLLFKLGTPETFAVFQSEIFRLEVFDPKDIQYSGNQEVIIYRSQTMPMLRLDELFSGSKHDIREKLNEYPTIIYRHQNRFFGMVVKSIGDFVETTQGQELNDHLKPSIVQGKTVTLVKFSELPIQNLTHFTRQDQPNI